MSPDYPRSGNFYTYSGDIGKYVVDTPPDGMDLSGVPRMNRAERRRQERGFKRDNKRSRGY
jgi:hypothetical protein